VIMSSKSSASRARSDDRSVREMLLDAASALMTDAESVRVPLEAIAQRARVTTPLLTYYFRTRNGLLLALAKRDTGLAMDQIHELMKQDLAPRKLLRIHISGIIRTFAARPYLNQLLHLLVQDEESASSREIRDTFLSPLVAAQREMIARGVAEGSFRSVEPAFAHFLITGASQQISFSKNTSKAILGSPADEATVREYTRFVTDMVLRALAP
jgi:TetR/AcrR family transcriptional regulator